MAVTSLAAAASGAQSESIGSGSYRRTGWQRIGISNKSGKAK